MRPEEIQQTQNQDLIQLVGVCFFAISMYLLMLLV